MSQILYIRLSIIIIYLLSFSYQTTITFSEPKDYFPRYELRRLYTFKQNPFLFNQDGVYQIYLDKDGQQLEKNSNFSFLFNIEDTTTNILSLSNGNYVIGCLNQNKLIEFTSNGSIIFTANFLELNDSIPKCGIGAYTKDKIFISFINKNLYGKIIIYSPSTQTFEHLQTTETWSQNYASTFYCQYFYLLQKILCIFSPNDLVMYYALYSHYGQHSSTKTLIDNNISDTILLTYFVILSDFNENKNVYGDVFVGYTTNNDLYFNKVRFTIDLYRRTQTQVVHTLKIPGEYVINSIFKVNEKLALVLLDFNQILLITDNLKILGKIDGNSKFNNIAGINVQYYMGSKTHFILEYTKKNNNKQRYLSIVNLVKCQDLNVGVGIYDYYDIMMSEMLYDNTTNTSKIKVIILTLPDKKATVYGWYGEEEDEVEIELNENNYTYNITRLSIYSEKIMNYTFSYYLSELIDEDNQFYIPSVPCTVNFEVYNTFNFQHCNEEVSVKDENMKCIPISDKLNLYQDENENRYYSMYLDYPISFFDYYSEQIFTILNIFINKTATNENKLENDAIININGKDFSFYYLPEKTSNNLLNNASSIYISSSCRDILISKYNLSSNESLYLSQYEIYQNNTNYPYNIEYEIYTNNGTKLNLSYCSSQKAQISYSLILMNLDYYYETGLLYFESGNIDIFNLSDNFYNDICYMFKSPNSKDTTLKLRRKEFYPNIALCPKNCTYQSVNFERRKVICECGIKGEKENDRVNVYEVKNYMEGFNQKPNILIIRCFKNFWYNLMENENCGFYILLFAFLGNVFLILYYFLISYEKIKKAIRKISNFTIPMSVSHFGEKQTTNTLCLQKAKIGTMNSNQKYTLNDSTYFSFSKFSGIKNCNSKSVFESTFFRHETQITPTKTDILFHKYWKLLQVHHCIVNILYVKSKFNRNNLKYLYIFSYVGLIFTISAFFYNNTVIENNYYAHKNINSVRYLISNNIYNTLLSFVSSLIISKILFYLVFAFLRLEHLKKSITNKDILLVEMRKAHFKVVLFFIINTILMLFHLYYCSIFCVMYPNSQTSWIISVMIALCFCFFAPFIYVWPFAILALFGKVYEHKGIKKFIKIVNNY